jgi:succinate-semialdehyde dehydrogenase/glutarate-semialdehyde dehydrogenase
MTLKLVSKNPATGETLRELDTTPVDQLATLFAQARAAQAVWATTSPKKRARALLNLRETVINQSDAIAALISNENGKPKFEALSNEVFPVVDSLTYFGHRGPGMLRDRPLKLGLMKHRKSYLQYWPLGVVAIISPWNYPFLLPFGEIITAILAGNAILFKPSEHTPLIGLKIQELLELSGFPPHLLQTIIGDGALGAALIQQKPAKVFFTGSGATGKKIMAAAAEHLIPVNLELGGKDPMIVLADANLEYASSAALWGAFSNSGQVCASTERILVHESVADVFLAKLKLKTEKLRPGLDLGVTTMERQNDVYADHLQDARAQGAEILVGGDFSADRRSLHPTIVAGAGIESTRIYNEETFGPVVAVTTFRSVAEAIQKANASAYGLTASVITRNLGLGEEIARQLETGTAMVNEVTYTAGLGETPWGGVKHSGFGRSHSEMGLLEFVNVRHVHKPRSKLFVFKSLWWFPYTPFQYAVFRQLLNLYRRSWIDKLRALSHLLWNLVQFIKNEKRL